jgi:lipopolysaccharide/colanic/teichoic acid biosynthesis glycosyltransferase
LARARAPLLRRSAYSRHPFLRRAALREAGVTGWAQVRYQYGSSVDDAINKLQYDLYYVKNHTLFLDTVVLFETVRVVLTGDGAH